MRHPRDRPASRLPAAPGVGTFCVMPNRPRHGGDAEGDGSATAATPARSATGAAERAGAEQAVAAPRRPRLIGDGHLDDAGSAIGVDRRRGSALDVEQPPARQAFHELALELVRLFPPAQRLELAPVISFAITSAQGSSHRMS